MSKTPEDKSQARSPLAPHAPEKGGTKPAGRLRRQGQALLDRGSHAADRVRVSTAGTFWSRLNAVDFMNSSIQFAALAVLCLFPFLVIVAAEAGGDARQTFVTRLGLDQAAARDVNALISPGNHAVSTLTVVGAAFVLFGAIGIASTLQTWYQRVFDQPPARRWTRQLVNRLIWLGGFLAYLALQVLVGRELAQVGARVPIYVVTFVVAVGFYWWTIHVLLLGRVGWGELFPAALATAVCVTGLSVFSALLFSGQIVSSHRNYGAIGVVTVLLSYLIGLGVCLHLGAVFGRIWNERHPQPSRDTNRKSADGPVYHEPPGLDPKVSP